MAMPLLKYGGKKKFVLAIVATSLPKMKKKKKIVLAIVAMSLPKMEKKKCFGNCGNGIAENWKKKML